MTQRETKRKSGIAHLFSPRIVVSTPPIARASGLPRVKASVCNPFLMPRLVMSREFARTARGRVVSWRASLRAPLCPATIGTSLPMARLGELSCTTASTQSCFPKRCTRRGMANQRLCGGFQRIPEVQSIAPDVLVLTNDGVYCFSLLKMTWMACVDSALVFL